MFVSAPVHTGTIHVRMFLPHIFVWEFLSLVLYIPSASSPPPSARAVSHNFVTHHLSHTQLCLATSTFVLRGRRGTFRHPHTLFAWQAWHLWHWAGSGGALGRHWSPVMPRQAWHFQTSTLCVRGMALVALGWLLWHAWAPLVAGGAAALCMAGVALGDIHALVAWQA